MRQKLDFFEVSNVGNTIDSVVEGLHFVQFSVLSASRKCVKHVQVMNVFHRKYGNAKPPLSKFQCNPTMNS